MTRTAFFSAAVFALALVVGGGATHALADNDERQARTLANQREKIDSADGAWSYDAHRLYAYDDRYDRDYGYENGFDGTYGKENDLDALLGTALAIGVVGALLDEGAGRGTGGALTALSQALVQGRGYAAAGYSGGRDAAGDAVEACERRGEQIVRSRGGGDFDIIRVTDVDRDYRGGFEIEGRSTSYYRYTVEQGRMSCSVRNGRVTSLRVR